MKKKPQKNKVKQPRYNAETQKAMKEINEMIKKGDAKKYSASTALFDTLKD